jgi:hypothetical protein
MDAQAREHTAQDRERTQLRTDGDRLGRSVVTRTAMFAVAILLLELGFIASYAGALHAPVPNRVPVAAVAPASAFDDLAAELHKADAPVQLQSAPAARSATNELRTGQVFAVIVVEPVQLQLLVASASGAAIVPEVQAVFSGVAAAAHVPLKVRDVAPLPAANARGLVQFYFVVGLVIGGYLLSVVLGLGGGMTPGTLRRGVRRLSVLALYSVVSAVLALLIVDQGFGYQSGHVAGLAALAALLVFSVGAFTMALNAAFGLIGTWLVIILFVILGNPSAGGAWPNILLATPWRQFGLWLPNGAGLDATRSILFLGSYDVRTPVLVLVGYALAGVVGVMLMSHRGRPLVSLTAEPSKTELAGLDA